MSIWTIRTILGFCILLTLTCIFPSIIAFLGKKSLFQVNGKINLFWGGEFSERVSSERLLAVSAAGPPSFFPETNISGFFGHAHFGKVCMSLYLVTF